MPLISRLPLRSGHLHATRRAPVLEGMGHKVSCLGIIIVGIECLRSAVALLLSISEILDSIQHREVSFFVNSMIDSFHCCVRLATCGLLRQPDLQSCTADSFLFGLADGARNAHDLDDARQIG